MAENKPFCISKWAVFSAWAQVRDNRGAAGVDGVSVEAFERKLKNNLYRVWNRMSSGTYFPPPVRRVMIPKADGRERPLGIPTVGDRVAQMVVKVELERQVEHLFHPDSYGYSSSRISFPCRFIHGTPVPSEQLRLQAEEVGAGSGRQMPRALLGVSRLSFRSASASGSGRQMPRALLAL